MKECWFLNSPSSVQQHPSKLQDLWREKKIGPMNEDTEHPGFAERKHCNWRHGFIKPTFIWNHTTPGREQQEGRNLAIWWTLIRLFRHIPPCLQPDVALGPRCSHPAKSFGHKNNKEVIKKEMKKNVLAFIQRTNAAQRAMFSWLNTNTNSIVVFIFALFKSSSNVHFISVFTAVFQTIFFLSRNKFTAQFFCHLHH